MNRFGIFKNCIRLSHWAFILIGSIHLLGCSLESSVEGTIAPGDPGDSLESVTLSSNSNDIITITEGEQINIVVLLSGPAPQDADIVWQVNDSADFDAASGMVSISKGDESKALSISTKDDAIYEPEESFTVTISSSNQSIRGSVALTIKITDNDSAPSVQFASTSSSATEGDGSVAFTVEQSAVSDFDTTISLNYSGTATGGGSDYSAAPTSVTIPAGQNTASFSLTLVDDSTIEVGGETIVLTIASANNASVGSQSSHTLSVSDNDNSPPSVTFSGPWYVLSSGSLTIPMNETASDADGHTLSFSSANQGTFGSVTNNTTSLVFSPAANTGADSFDFTVDDGNGGSTTATMTVHVVTPYTWTGAGGDSNWSTAGNWCAAVSADKKSCTNSGTAPNSNTDSTHVAIFDGTCQSNCSPTISTSTSVYKIEMNEGFSGTLTQGAGAALTIGNQGFYQKSGTFQGSDANIDIDLDHGVGGLFHLDGGTFTSTSGELYIHKHGYVRGNSGTSYIIITADATFNHNNGTVRLKLAESYWGEHVYHVDLYQDWQLYNFTIEGFGSYGSGTNFTQTGNVIVQNDFTYPSTYGLVYGNDIYLYGNATLNGTTAQYQKAKHAIATLVFTGTNNQTYTYSGSDKAMRVRIDKSAGTVTPASGTTSLNVAALNLAQGSFQAPTGTFEVGYAAYSSASRADDKNILTVASGTSFDHNSGTILLNGRDTHSYTMDFFVTLPAGVSLFNAEVAGSDISFVNDISIANNLTITGRDVIGNLYVAGNLVIDNNRSSDSGPATITLNGTSAQSITQTSGIFPTGLVSVNNSSGLVSLTTALSLNSGQDFTLTAGDIDMAGFAFDVPGNLHLESGTSLTKNGGTLTYGTLSGSGTINP